MENLTTFDDVNDKIITIRNQSVILDSDVAELYGVETRRINEAVKNNLDKFPKGYIIELKNSEFYDVRSKISTANLEKTRVLPKPLTEKGLYMLATILKSPQATLTTIAIVEAFAQIRELSRNNIAIQDTTDEVIHQSLLQRTGQIINNVLFSNTPIDSSETSVELNLGLMKVKHAVKSDLRKRLERDKRNVEKNLKKEMT
jgi:enoyl reductase-like protein